jgi:lysophospholipase L1-like esterase
MTLAIRRHFYVMQSPEWIERPRQLSRLSRISTTLNFSSKCLDYTVLKKYSLIDNVVPNVSVNITNLHPRDIKAVICFGDSIFSGLCLTSNPNSLKNTLLSTLGSKTIAWLVSAEHRQNTCISGGNTVSVGRLLQYYSPDIEGLDFAKTHLFSKGRGLNFAYTGAKLSNLKDQVSRCIVKLQSNQFKHLIPQWKLIFIWIGSNDCLGTSLESIKKNFKAKLVFCLNSIKATLSKSFVAIITLPYLGYPHLTSSQDETRQKVEYVNLVLAQVVEEYNWDEMNYFKVALLPIPTAELENIKSFSNELDGIHPNTETHQFFAKCIWNNLFLKQKMRNVEEIIRHEWIKPDNLNFA